ncbi:hypothetical protein D3C80_980760 [compost metagenome]
MQGLDVNVRYAEALLEKFGEQRMQSVPRMLAFHVHRHDEQVACFDIGNQFASTGRLADVSGDCEVKTAQDGDLFKERHDRCRQVTDHVFDQVIHQAGLARQQAITFDALAWVGL